MKPLDKPLLLEIYRKMVSVRTFEETAADLFLKGQIPGFLHVYVGEEAVAAGVMAHLTDQDFISSTHRGHGHAVAKGARLDMMMAELFGKKTGYCHGKGGSMHIADPDTGNLGANAIVCGSAGIATGAALSAKRLKTGQVAVCFFGDGAMGQGLLYEVMNMAALWKLPVIYVCENNQYAMTVSLEKSTAVKQLSVRGQAYGFEGKTIDGNDVEAVCEATQAAAAKGRGGGLSVTDADPSLVERSARSFSRTEIPADLRLSRISLADNAVASVSNMTNLFIRLSFFAPGAFYQQRILACRGQFCVAGKETNSIR